MENIFEGQRVPSNYVYCFNNQCPRNAQCLRYLAAQNNPSETLVSLNPKRIPDDTSNCAYFNSTRKIRIAWGIKHLLDYVPHKNGSTMRRHLIAYFERNVYYSIYRSERGVLPEEQEYIRKLFRSYGIEAEPKFERYTEEYYFGNQ